MVTRKEAIAVLTAPGQPLEIEEVTSHGKRIRVFKNAPPTLRDFFDATRSDKTFLVYEDERLTYEEAYRKAASLGAALVEDYGIRKGDRVAISMRNYPEWVISFTAITSIGAIAVGFNALWRPEEMGFGIEDSGAKVLVLDQERIDRLEAIGGAGEGIAVIGVRTTKPLPAGAKTWDEVLGRHPASEMPKADLSPDDDVLMFYTSGTTGNPKGVVSTHRAVINPVLSWELDLHVAIMRGILPKPVPDAPQTVTLLGIPLFHVTGLHAICLTCYRFQRRLVLMYKWEGEKAAQIIQRERVTHFTAPSAVTGDLVEVAKRGGYDLSSLVSVSGGGAPRPPEQVRAIAKVFGNARPGIGWGMTETNAIGAGISSQDYLDRPESTGQASGVMDLRIATEDGRELPAGQRGELQVRGAGMMREYWNRPDATAEAFLPGGWFKTGDVAYMDDEGYVFIVDRIKDIIIRGGENIACPPVESVIAEHPAVVEACVYGVPDPRLGEEVAATVHVEGACDPNELQSFLAGRLARHEVPKHIFLTHEPLPRIASGKVLKRQLRAEAIERLTTEPAAAV